MVDQHEDDIVKEMINSQKKFEKITLSQEEEENQLRDLELFWTEILVQYRERILRSLRFIDKDIITTLIFNPNINDFEESTWNTKGILLLEHKIDTSSEEDDAHGASFYESTLYYLLRTGEILELVIKGSQIYPGPDEWTTTNAKVLRVSQFAHKCSSLDEIRQIIKSIEQAFAQALEEQEKKNANIGKRLELVEKIAKILENT
jgi:hypothetical protein